MTSADLRDPADMRAFVARHQLSRYQLAAAVGIHPSRETNTLAGQERTLVGARAPLSQ